MVIWVKGNHLINKKRPRKIINCRTKGISRSLEGDCSQKEISKKEKHDWNFCPKDKCIPSTSFIRGEAVPSMV